MVLFLCCRLRNKQAGMAELADALASGASGGNTVEVQFLLPAPNFLPQQSHNFAVVAERQTRQLEGLVRETSCGFKSRQPHQLSKHAGKSERARQQISYAGMAELADALASGASGGNPVEVQVLLPAPFKSEHTVKAVCFCVCGKGNGPPGCGCLSLYDAGSDAPLVCPCLSRRTQNKQRMKKSTVLFLLERTCQPRVLSISN